MTELNVTSPTGIRSCRNRELQNHVVLSVTQSWAAQEEDLLAFCSRTVVVEDRSDLRR